ncbi:MAG: Holliday junction branch migration protein RuvA [Roseovarius sp.]|uniref:Holliday junction branch migration protein RuvA n=1 Tax=Roseovarius sp. TaxID=1486281 RepID=UPI001B7813E0|nr:Holliday junction branch migration protein RuvA [Roseovarius sp.]MBQ0750767.1 Holliday junction branch migration protein RuvA [Roseovarius sp.]MBQ0810150.1 Holliday junction branch migration protein RuvA [Roseovarius sp.]
MIGRVAGRIDYRGTDHVLIDVRGVGYLVYCSERTLSALPGVGGMAALYTDLLVREDLLQLFGFPTLVEKEWHRLLMSVQGVGAKASLAILGALGPEGVGRAIAIGDWNSVTAAKGIGAKTAQRVVNELKDKAPLVMAMGAAPPPAPPSPDTGEVIETVLVAAPATVPPSPGAQAEALSALTNLGYSPGEAAGAVAQVAGEMPEGTTSDLIRAALRRLAPKG